jgi:hypothetical protein
MHKFRVGQNVELAPSVRGNIQGGIYEIKKTLPERNDEFQYQIKSVSEPHERVARESELTEFRVMPMVTWQ